MIYLAHRGFWRPNGIENSILSFQNTVDYASDTLHGFECDLRQVSDKDPTSWVVSHDAVSDYSNLVSLYDFLKWFGTVQQKQVVNIEIKHGTPQGIQYLVDAVNYKKQSLTDVFYSSFDINHIELIQKNTNEDVSFLFCKEDDLDQLINKKNLRYITIGHHHIFPDVFNMIGTYNIGAGVYFKSLNEYKHCAKTYKNNKNIHVIFSEPDGTEN